MGLALEWRELAPASRLGAGCVMSTAEGHHSSCQSCGPGAVLNGRTRTHRNACVATSPLLLASFHVRLKLRAPCDLGPGRFDIGVDSRRFANARHRRGWRRRRRRWLDPGPAAGDPPSPAAAWRFRRPAFCWCIRPTLLHQHPSTACSCCLASPLGLSLQLSVPALAACVIPAWSL